MDFKNNSWDINKLSAIQVGLASPEAILEWSHGEVKKPETINYRSQKPERDGLFCEKIFGPAKDYECACGKYKKIRHSGTVCEKCGVEITTKSVRRERMGHIDLASPVVHIWYLRGSTSKIGELLDISLKRLEEVVYFVSRIVLKPGTCPLLGYREVLEEKVARERFGEIFANLLTELEEGNPDKEKISGFVDKLKNMNEAFDFVTYSQLINKYYGAEFGMGAEAIFQLLKEVDLEKEFSIVEKDLKESTSNKSLKRLKLLRRLEIIEAFRKSNNKPEWMILKALPVIPPDLRPMLQLDGGRFATSDLNDLYRRVITRNTRLKKLIEINAPFVILMNEKRMLQEAVDALIDNGRRSKAVTGAAGRPLKSLSHALKGKQGRFRQNLLGKRVDYSGRSVIAVGPTLKMYQCGIPREMAVQLFKPFIASEMIRKGIANGHKQADKLIERYDEKVWDVVEEVIKEHLVLLNRAPTLHRLGIQAFEPVLVEGRAIRLHPLVTPAFNADFDGDQMAVHVPLSQEARTEARLLMLGSQNILGPKDGKPIVTPSQDMVLGNYYLTLEHSDKDFLDKAKELDKEGNKQKAELYRYYAECEGKVFKDQNEVVLAYENKLIHIHNRIAIPASGVGKNTFNKEENNMFLLTSVGKIIFNQIFSEDYPYINEPTEENFRQLPAKYLVPRGSNIKEIFKKAPLSSPFKKKHLGLIINDIFNRYGTTETSIMLDKMKDLGFKHATLAGVTIAISDINVVEDKVSLFIKAEEEVQEIAALFQKGLLTNEERHNQVINIWSAVKDRVQDRLSKQLELDDRNPIFMMANSGARGNISNFTQLAGMRGLMASPSGEIIELPIKSNFREGLTMAEFFSSTHGARKGGADTAIKTADSGYLTRRLVDVAQDVIVKEDDCGTDHGFVVSEIVDSKTNAIIVPLYDRLVGRFAMRDIINKKTGELLVAANELIDEGIAKKIVATDIKEVEIRSIFTCETNKGVCKKCYGRNLATGGIVERGESVGTMAAQSIGEPGTQLTMRTFHTGGVAGGNDITQGLPRVQELFEARKPKGEATISGLEGEIVKVEEEDGIAQVTVRHVISNKENEEKTYKTTFGARLRVKVGDKIQNGQKITDGAINPKELLEVSDVRAVQNYLLKEVQRVYRLTGMEISDKHIEIMIRQMLIKVLIIEGGDTKFLPATKINLSEFTEENSRILREGKRPAVARPLILGITKAALEVTSFLSAASFQETTRVLTDAAIKGKVDLLQGLKENVITGKLIPAGTGLPEYQKVDYQPTEDDVFTEEEDKSLINY